MASLKAEIDKIDSNKLKTVPVDLGKLSNVVNNDVVKKTVYDKLVAKVNNVDTSGFVIKTKYDTDKSELEKKISDADNSGLATTAALTTVENKVPGVSNIVKKIDFDVKLSDIEPKYFTSKDYNKFTSQTLDAKIKKKELVDKPAIAGF